MLIDLTGEEVITLRYYLFNLAPTPELESVLTKLVDPQPVTSPFTFKDLSILINWSLYYQGGMDSHIQENLLLER